MRLSRVIILFFIAIASLIVFRKDVSTFFPPEHLLGNYPLHIDLFCAWKQIFTEILASILLCLLLKKFLEKKYLFLNLAKNKFNFHGLCKNNFIPYLLLFLIFIQITLSTVFSAYPKVSFLGYFSLAQGYLLEISYFLIFIYFSLSTKLKDSQFFLNGFLFILFIIIVLSLLQFYGYFYLDTNFAHKYFSTMGYNFSFGNYSLSGPLGNPNYMGSFVALFLPLTFALFFAQRKFISKSMIALLSAGTFAMAIACNSRAGYIGCFFGVLCAIFILKKQIIIQWKYSLALFICYLIVFFLFQKSFTNEIVKSGKEISKINSEREFSKVNSEKKFIFYTSKNTFTYAYGVQWIKIIYDNGRIYFNDLKNSPIYASNSPNGLKFNLDDENYLTLNPQNIQGNNALSIKTNLYNFTLVVKDNRFKVMHPGLLTLFETTNPRLFFPQKFDHLFSFRGYIWSRTLPLIIDKPFLGHGFQTFVYFFPNNDIEGLMNIQYPLGDIFDKPHSMYMQLAFDHGLIGLILYLSLFLYCVIKVFILFMKNQTLIFKEQGILCLACTVAIVGYLFTAIFNDSWNGVSIYFWIFLGMSWGLYCSARDALNLAENKL